MPLILYIGICIIITNNTRSDVDMGDSNNVSSGQMSLFDALGIPDNLGESTSAQEIADVIKKLQKAQQAAQIREEKERRKREREEARRKACEEKERKEAHIREVTSMDLPLDWNNISMLYIDLKMGGWKKSVKFDT